MVHISPFSGYLHSRYSLSYIPFARSMVTKAMVACFDTEFWGPPLRPPWRLRIQKTVRAFLCLYSLSFRGWKITINRRVIFGMTPSAYFECVSFLTRWGAEKNWRRRDEARMFRGRPMCSKAPGWRQVWAYVDEGGPHHSSAPSSPTRPGLPAATSEVGPVSSPLAGPGSPPGHKSRFSPILFAEPKLRRRLSPPDVDRVGKVSSPVGAVNHFRELF